MKIIKEPQKIIDKSFALIKNAIGNHEYSDDEFPIVVRIAHSTGDTDFAKEVMFSPGAVQSGLKAIKKGCNIVVDVKMVEAGVSKEHLSKYGCKSICHISDVDVISESKKKGVTRSIISMGKAIEEIENGIVAVGNAPTALFELIRLIREENVRPALVVGFPVGFVGAEESKRELSCMNISFMTNLSKRGGTPVAVSAVNALLRMAADL